MKIKIFFFFLAFFQTAYAQDFSALINESPEEIFAKSLETHSQSEKLILRAYLKDKFPDTKEGLFSTGFVENRNGHTEKAKKIFNECVNKFPDFAIAREYYINLLIDSNEKVKHYQYGLQHNISFGDYGFLRSYYFLLANTFKNQDSADKMLNEYEQKLDHIFIFDFIRGLSYQFDLKDTLKALRFYKLAINKREVTCEVFQKIINLELELANEKGYSTNEKVKILTNYFLKYDSIKPKDPEMLEYLGDKLLNDFNAESEAYDYYKVVFNLKPTSEIVEKIIDLGRKLYINSYKSEEYALLKKALHIMPDNFSVLNEYGMYLTQKNDTTANVYLNKALRRCILRKDSVYVMLQLTSYYEHFFLYDKAYTLYTTCNNLVDTTNSNFGIIEYYIAKNKAMMGDYSSAIQYMRISRDKKRLIKNIAEEHYQMAINDFESKLKLYIDRDNYLRNNTFQEYWFKRWGEECVFNFLYTANSIALNSSELIELKEAATMLNSKDGQNYLILIRGLFKQGDINLDLSNKRAKWIGRYLENVFGIGAERIRYESVNLCKGCKIGDKKGYIEIIPTSKITNPIQLVTTRLPINGRIATSPDGKYIAVGVDQIQIWDIERKIMVMELPSGGVRKFSPDGRYLAFISSYNFPGNYRSNTLYIYDMKLQIMKSERSSDVGYGFFDWSPAGDKLVFSLGGQVIAIYNISKNLIEKQRFAAEEEIRGIVWSRAKDVIVTGERVNDNVKIWDSKSLQLLDNLTGFVQWTHSMNQTSDGKYLLVADNTRHLTRFDMMNWNATPLQIVIPVLAREIVNEPFSHRIAINDWAGSEQKKVVIINTDNGSIQSLNGYENSSGIAFSALGNKLFRESKSNIEVISTSLLKVIDTISGYASEGKWGFADTARNNYISIDQNSVSVWDVTTGKKVHYWNLKLENLVDINGTYLLNNKFYALICDNQHFVSILVEFDMLTFSVKQLLTSAIRVQHATISDTKIILCGIKSFSHVANSYLSDQNGYIEIYDKNSLKKVNSFTIPIPTERLVQDNLYDSGFEAIATNNDNKLAVITYWKDGFGMDVKTSKEIRLYDVQSSRKIRSIVSERKFDYLFFTNDSTLTAMNSGYGWVYNSNTGQYIGYVNHGTTDKQYSISKNGKNNVSKNFNILAFKNEEIGIKHIIPGFLNLSVFPKRNIAVTYQSDNRIKFFGLNNFQEIITICNLNNNEWIAAKPSGQYESSLYGAKNAYWILGDNYLPITALKETFEVPKLIKRNLTDVAFLTEVNSSSKGDTLDISPILFQLPYEYKINTNNNRPIYTSDSIYTILVTVKRLEQKYSFPTINLTKDGRYFDNVISPIIKQITKDSMVIKFPIRIFSGTENHYEVVMKVLIGSNNADLILGKLSINSSNKNASYKPSLWYLGVGVTYYKNQDQNLKFADKDIYSVSSLVKKQEGKLYSNVNTKVLCNESATIDSIKSGLWDYLTLAKDRDLIIIHISGHGVKDGDDELYFVQYDGGMNTPEKSCFSINEVLKFLKSKRRPPNQKILLLLDICHSGAFNEESKGIVVTNTASGDDLIKKLSDGTGSIIMASSTGKQPSYESNVFGGGHGAFSYAIIEALDGLSPQKDKGKLYITDLISYIMLRVPNLVNEAKLGTQTPKINIDSFRDDFPVAEMLIK